MIRAIGPLSRRIRAALLAVLLVLPVRPSLAADETLELAVLVNGYDIGKIGEFVQRGDVLFVRPSEMAELGFSLPAAPAGGDLVSLSAIPGLRWRLDAPRQAVEFTAGFDLLRPVLLRPPQTGGQAEPAESGSGATLNYDLLVSSTAGKTVGSGLLDMRAFAPWGVFSTNAIAYGGASPGGGSNLLRLDSSYVLSDPASMRRYRFGDAISGGLNWTRPVRLGGFQLDSDFSMRPDLITFPLPTISGAAAVPSTVDVLVGNSHLLSSQVAPGPFEIPQLPVVTGAGTVTTTVTNALGQQVRTSLPFYASADLLAPGLRSYSLEFGWVRHGWGLAGDDYGTLAASATYRRGLSDMLTGEFHAETSQDQVLGGAAILANVFNLGVVNAGIAASGGAGPGGMLFSIGAQRIGQVFSAGVSALFASRGFTDIAALSGDPFPQRQLNANFGVSLGAAGTIGLAYTGLDRRMVSEPVGFSGLGGYYVAGLSRPGGSGRTSYGELPYVPPHHVHMLSASYSVQLGALSLFATGFSDLAGADGNGGMIGLTLPLGARQSASVNGGTDGRHGYSEFQAVQSPVLPGDWGYQAYVSGRDPNHDFADVQYKSSFGLFSAGLDYNDRQTTWRGEAAGAVTAMDGALFASNSIYDSFAVVDTSGVPGITVREENRPVGRTDASGRILVSDLRAYEPNHISIDPTEVPVSDSLAYSARLVRPQDRSGVLVRFPIRQNRAALVVLQDALGKPMPVGSVARLAATGISVPVGYDGQAYVEDLAARANRLEVETLDGRRCRAMFDYQSQEGTIPRIGPVSCRAE